MKKLFLSAAVATLLFQASCITTERETATSKSDGKIFTPTPPNQRARLTERSILNTVRASHNFTSNKEKDSFVLLLQGPKILNAQARFIIINATGDTIRNEVMPATALLSDRDLENPSAATVRDKEIAILKAMNTFFSNDRFTQPAIPRNADQPEDVEPQVWAAIQGDNKAVGFDYIGAGGRERRIAYAKELQRAVVVAQ
ncbi:hypothetical protein GCM10011375_16800 [Hymenobacter qilianensis]|uniref:Uncharacterized protein n=2 Tax=Hymenobacter qilianensis TaxID=1385715 RepID=A0ACB5PQN9_9BACT|nr:hypothetical protein [Hymenobacter qilianensis]QNP51882.1 hypothetical protein H9L05_18395 [Hymenobacter qilianensis]GGF62459.1 hypothetical protein GCM10011375_16800 [Hymenobacter qilianensis]